MLIRSQDKTVIVNINNVFSIAIRDINGATAMYIGSQGSCCNMAEYSTKAKAMKVLDMIQEAYGDSEYTKYVIPIKHEAKNGRKQSTCRRTWRNAQKRNDVPDARG